MADLKANSLRVRFDRGSAEPSDADIFSFMKEKMKLRCDDLLSMYKDKTSMSVIIKFKSEDDLVRALERLPGSMDFVYDKYRSCKVQLSAANAVVRYIRMFNLPPEVEDKEIWNVMSKYGKIQRMVREKYGVETGFPIWTSVRGVYMELKDGEEIPGIVSVRNIQARVYYQGLLNKCFQCGSVEHIKVDCPSRKSVNDRLKGDQNGSYSGALKGNWSKTKANSNTTLEKPDALQGGTMTNLNEFLESDSTKHAGPSTTGKDKDSVGQSSSTTSDKPSCSQQFVLSNIVGEEKPENTEKTQRMEGNGVSHTAGSDELSHTQQMETGGVSHATEPPHHMETEEFSLKRARDGEQRKSKVESDESSLSDTSDSTKAVGDLPTLSGWQKVMTRNRSKQLKLSQETRRSKSASENP